MACYLKSDRALSSSETDKYSALSTVSSQVSRVVKNIDNATEHHWSRLMQLQVGVHDVPHKARSTWHGKGVKCQPHSH